MKEPPKKLKKRSAAPRTNLASLLEGCSGFEIKVYKCILRIPQGQRRSYAWVAGEIGNPGAARAVAQALKRNPWPLIIPCHRVVSSNGKIGGYAYGIELKKLFLELERGKKTFNFKAV
ncbi:MAG: MGMT family protein [Candidatus Omnitrophota bacterium]